MTSEAIAVAIRAVVEAHAPPTLATLATQLRHEHPGDPDAHQVARMAELKRRRLVAEN